jgi:DNA-binding CsgD family transcriptional regulator
MQSAGATLGDVIGAIGAPDFVARTAGTLGRFTGFDLAAILVHPRSGRPRILFDNFDQVGCRAGVETYAHVTYRANPMLAGGGVVRARDFAPARGRAIVEIEAQLVRDADEELGFRTAGWPARQEEIGLYLPGWDGVIELGFYRPRGRGLVSDAKLAALGEIAQPLAAAFDRHRALVGERAAPSWRTLLTAREEDVCGLLLLGCSSDAIALRLGISRHTVKDHRKHIFRKLGVASLAELFATVH